MKTETFTEVKKDILCIHHTDLDGSASAAIIGYWAYHNGRGVDYLAFNYKDFVPSVDEYKEVWVVDVSFVTKEATANQFKEWQKKGLKVGWIDHHKTVINGPDIDKEIPGIRKVGIGACELTWEYFIPGEKAPQLIQFLSAYDVWDKERFAWRDVIAVQYAARAMYGMTNPKAIVCDLLNRIRCNDVTPLIVTGERILGYVKEKNRSECEQYAFEAKIKVQAVHNYQNAWKKSFTAICMNTLEFNSTTFDSVYDPDAHKLMIAFAYVSSLKQFKVSIYSTHDDIDCGELAKAFGGGGHKGAAGFHLDLNRMNHFLLKRKLDFYPEV